MASLGNRSQANSAGLVGSRALADARVLGYAREIPLSSGKTATLGMTANAFKVDKTPAEYENATFTGPCLHLPGFALAQSADVCGVMNAVPCVQLYGVIDSQFTPLRMAEGAAEATFS
jgi:hypothetical protein